MVKAHNKFLKFEEDLIGEVDILTFDLESYEWINFIVLGFYDIQKDHYVYFDSLKAAIPYMFEYCAKNKYKYIFGHFAGKFDFNFILDSIYKDFYDYYLDCAIPRGGGYLSMKIKKKDCDDEITFCDSSALLPMGLAKLAKMMGVETQKGTCDFYYIKKAWDNIDYRDTLLTDEYTDEYGKSILRNKVFIDGKECKSQRKLRDVSKDRITYFSEEDGKEHKIYDRSDVLFYLKDDCVSLAQSLKKFYDLPFIKKAKKSKTIAGQSLNVLKTYFNKDQEDKIRASTKREDEFVRKGYFGGRTEIFKYFFSNSYDIKKNELKFNKKTLGILKKQKNKTLKVYDVNSLYPTCMLERFPTEGLSVVKGKKNYDKYEFGMWRVKVQVPLDAPFPFLGGPHVTENGNTKFCFVVGEFDGYWTKHELEYAKSIGYKIIKYYEGFVYIKSDYIFKNFIEDMYAMRLKAHREGDEATKGIVKLIMNSTYGKIGMRTDDKKFLRETNIKTDEYYKNIIIAGNRKVMIEEVESQSDNIFHKVIIPAYVTAYARILMHKLLLKCGEDNVYYTDTDSIFTTETMETGDGLGKLKLEYEANEAVFLMPKTYSVDDIINAEKRNKITMKGFDYKKVKTFTHKALVDFKYGEVRTLKAYDPAKFMTLGSARMKGSFLGLVRSKEDELRRYNERTRALRELELKAKNDGNLLLKKQYSIRIAQLTETFNKQSSINYKEIKSRYDKRLNTDDEINTKPIVKGVINGIFESEIKKKGRVKFSSKYGPIVEE